MAIKNTRLGGTDLAYEEVLTAANLNDTFIACLTYTDTRLLYSIAPVGSVVAFIQTTIPSGWISCDGSTITDSDSVYYGQTSPDLNGTTDTDSLFLRGNTTSGGTGGTIEHTHVYSIDEMNGSTNSYAAIEFLSAPNIPKFFGVKWIMRIK